MTQIMEPVKQSEVIYGVFGGEYSDWYVVGYFTDKLKAEKYCALQREEHYYIGEIKCLDNGIDLSSVSLAYEHEVVFDLCRDGKWHMRDEPNRYSFYMSNMPRRDSIRDGRYLYKNSWIAFKINLHANDRKRAEKIAQDRLAKYLALENGL